MRLLVSIFSRRGQSEDVLLLTETKAHMKIRILWHIKRILCYLLKQLPTLKLGFFGTARENLLLLTETTAHMKIRILWHSTRGCFVTY